MSVINQQALDTSPQSAPRSKKGNFAALALIVVVFVLVAGFFAHAGVFGGGRSGGSTWTTFHDKAGDYTVRIPSDWKVTTRTFTTMLTSASTSPPKFAQPTEIVTITKPGSQQNVSILAAAMTGNDTQHIFYCHDAAHQPFRTFPNKTFSGVSATSIGPSSWQFDTTSAHVEISTTLPNGQQVPWHTDGQTNQPELSLLGSQDNEILASIQIANTNLLVC